MTVDRLHFWPDDDHDFRLSPYEVKPGKVVRNKRIHLTWFELRPELGYVWLQKLAIWTLRKLQCFVETEEVQTTSIKMLTIDRGDLFEKLMRHCQSVKAHVDAGEELVLVIGEREMREIIGEAAPGTTAWSCLAEYHHSTFGSRKLLGLPVIVVPWMTGFAAIPNRLLRS